MSCQCRPDLHETLSKHTNVPPSEIKRVLTIIALSCGLEEDGDVILRFDGPRVEPIGRIVSSGDRE